MKQVDEMLHKLALRFFVPLRYVQKTEKEQPDKSRVICFGLNPEFYPRRPERLEFLVDPNGQVRLGDDVNYGKSRLGRDALMEQLKKINRLMLGEM